MSSREEILRFWFGDTPDGLIASEVQSRWWKKDPTFDEEIRSRFGDLHAIATRGELDDWRDTPTGRLALILVLDQFSRNLYRDDPRAWAQDPAALAHAHAGIDGGEDALLTPFQRTFLYMPLMHAEDPASQARCIRKFVELAAATDGALAERLAGNVDYARKHAVIVERFGRFPHRNATLGRTSTPEETEFLKGPNSSF